MESKKVDECRHYEIRIKGHLDHHHRASWFDGLTILLDGGETVLIGMALDQPALHGLLKKIRDLAMPLISVTSFPIDTPDQ